MSTLEVNTNSVTATINFCIIQYDGKKAVVYQYGYQNRLTPNPTAEQVETEIAVFVASAEELDIDDVIVAEAANTYEVGYADDRHQ